MVTMDENDLGSVKKWQAYQLHETWPSLIGRLLSFEHFKGYFEIFLETVKVYSTV